MTCGLRGGKWPMKDNDESRLPFPFPIRFNRTPAGNTRRSRAAVIHGDTIPFSRAYDEDNAKVHRGFQGRERQEDVSRCPCWGADFTGVLPASAHFHSVTW